jgi:uncharacterized protein YaaR (DUF327 family)
MKVREDRLPIQDVTHGQALLGKRGAAEGAAPFESMLQERSQANTKETLNKLLERINEQGEIISRRKDITM